MPHCDTCVCVRSGRANWRHLAGSSRNRRQLFLDDWLHAARRRCVRSERLVYPADSYLSVDSRSPSSCLVSHIVILVIYFWLFCAYFKDQPT